MAGGVVSRGQYKSVTNPSATLTLKGGDVYAVGLNTGIVVADMAPSADGTIARGGDREMPKGLAADTFTEGAPVYGRHGYPGAYKTDASNAVKIGFTNKAVSGTDKVVDMHLVVGYADNS